MKPPPRQRSKPKRDRCPCQLEAHHSRALLTEWKRKERYQLLAALNKLERTAGGESEIDYVFLRKSVPTRTSYEIRSAVETLKDKVITSTKLKLFLQERREKKSIELWTDLACVVAGKLIKPISAAFSQMLIVSSTEPCTLKNSVHDPSPSPGRGRPISRTGSIGCLTCSQANGGSSGSKPTCAAAHVPRLRAPTSSVPPSSAPTSSVPPSSAPTSSVPPSSAPDTPVSSSVPPVSPEPSAGSFPSSDVKYSVNFEKIYHYLSAVHEESDTSCLNPMESAIVLDLIMSLPEELRLLDCKKLHRHLKQVYQCLTAPAQDVPPKQEERTKCCTASPREGVGQTQAPSGDKISIETSEPAGVTGLNPQSDDGQPSKQSHDASLKSDETNVTWRCPPLNPFMVPLKLLKRQ